MFYLLVMAALICFVSGAYLALSGLLVAGIILISLGVIITDIIFVTYSRSRNKYLDCTDCSSPDCSSVDCCR